MQWLLEMHCVNIIKFAITDIIFHRRLKCINAWLLAKMIKKHNFSTATLCLHDHYYHSKVWRVDRTVKWLTSSPILCRHAGWHQIVNDIRGISKSIRHFIRQFIRHLTTLSVSLSVTWPLHPSLDNFICHLTISSVTWPLTRIFCVHSSTFADNCLLWKSEAAPFICLVLGLWETFKFFWKIFRFLKDIQVFGRFSGFWQNLKN